MEIIFGILIIFLIGSAIYKHFKRLDDLAFYKARNYSWYKFTYPDCVNGNKVMCKTCGNSIVHTKSLMHQTYTRIHFCAQCGENLFYSQE